MSGAIAVSPKGNLALVANYEDGTVSPISLPDLAVEASVVVIVGANRPQRGLFDRHLVDVERRVRGVGADPRDLRAG